MTPTITPRANRIISLRAMLVLFGVLGYASFGQAQSYTIMPQPFGLVQDNSGHVINGGCVWTYTAGTTTPIATYSDNAGTLNTNPIKADSAGRFTAYLLAGTSYKFVYENIPCTVSPPTHGSVLRTADNIAGTPAAAAVVDMTCTAGETISAGQAIYISDGSGSKQNGQCYKADTANGYSSSTATVVGIAPSAIASGSAGTLRIAGSVGGLTSLTAGSPYYVGASGAITTTAPAGARLLGMADTVSSLMLSLPQAAQPDNGIDDFRLTLTTATPVTTVDVTAATTLFCTPNGHGNRIVLFDSVGNATIYKSAEFSIAVPATTSQMYDVFAFSSSGTPTLELLAWTNDTTRATAIVTTTTGVYTKSGDLTRRYLGSFRTTGSSGQTEDSIAKRYVWNYYNRADRPMRVIDAAASWAYTTNTLRQANANAANQLDFVLGVQEDVVVANVMANASDTTGGVFLVGIGLDSTSANATGITVAMGSFTSNSIQIGVSAMYRSYPDVGRHTLVWLEAVVSGTSTTWWGTSKFQTGNSSGITGIIKG